MTEVHDKQTEGTGVNRGTHAAGVEVASRGGETETVRDGRDGPDQA